MKKLTAIAVAALFATACGSSQSADPVDPIDTTDTADTTDTTDTTTPTKVTPEPGMRMVSMDQLTWNPLDPEAGAAGPQVAQLFDDMTAGPSGLFVKAPAGFPGAPHIHTNAYHGVVIKGTIMNDAPDAKPIAMGPGAYWAQQGGMPHITACTDECMAFIYFEGNFDGHPPDAKMAAMGPESKNTPLDQVQWMPGSELGEAGPMLGPLWGDMKSGPNGFLVKLPAGFPGAWHWHTSDYHAVTIQGTTRNWEEGDAMKDTALTVGTYWMQPGKTNHITACDAGEDCIVYVQMPGPADSHVTEQTPVPN
jgi:hypothetical protein